MAYITKQKLIEIINNRPPGTTPEGIIAGLKEKGHQLEDYPETGKSTTITDMAEFEKRIMMS